MSRDLWTELKRVKKKSSRQRRELRRLNKQLQLAHALIAYSRLEKGVWPNLYTPPFSTVHLKEEDANEA